MLVALMQVDLSGLWRLSAETCDVVSVLSGGVLLQLRQKMTSCFVTQCRLSEGRCLCKVVVLFVSEQ